MVSEKEQTKRSTEQTREPRDRPPYIEPTDLCKGPKVIDWSKEVFSTNDAGISGQTYGKK